MGLKVTKELGSGEMAKFKHGATPGPFIESVLFERGRISDPNHYAFILPSLKGLMKLDLHPKVTFFVGENGSGKSTLLEAIAIANGLNPEGGSRNMQFETRASHSELYKIVRLRRYHALVPDAWFMRAESLFNVASEIDNLGVGNSYGGKSLHEQSHGEAFMTLVENRFSQGLYFLDEPEAALSPQRQLEFLVLMHQLIEKQSQVVIATHSPIIMSYPDAKIYSFSEAGVRPVAYEDTEHYRVTRSFLESPERMLGHLLGKRTKNRAESP
jgi:predicted ATPase